MNGIENVLIILGISLDVFASMECEGSLVAKIEKKHLIWICLLFSLWQMAALYIGNFLSGLLIGRRGIAENEIFIGSVISAAIFFCLGIRFIIKAVKNERIYEHRENALGFRKMVHLAAFAGIYTLLAGLAFGFVGTSLQTILILIVCFTIMVVVAGTYTGYHFGFEQKGKAYLIGAVLLWLSGADVIICHILKVF